MPDLMIHACSVLLINKLRPRWFTKTKNLLLFFLIGNLLPDIMGKMPVILFPKYTEMFTPAHTLLGGFIISYIFMLLFELPIRKQVFLAVLIGTVFHQVLDLIQKNVFGTGYRIFFPLTYEIKLGFIWPEDSVYALPFLILIVAILYRKNINLKNITKTK